MKNRGIASAQVNSIFMAVELEFEGRINGEELHQTVANRVRGHRGLGTTQLASHFQE